MPVQIIITDPHLMESADLMQYVDMLSGMAGYGRRLPTEERIPPGAACADGSGRLRDLQFVQSAEQTFRYEPATADAFGKWSTLDATLTDPALGQEHPSASIIFGGRVEPDEPFDPSTMRQYPNPETAAGSEPTPPATEPAAPSTDSRGLPWDGRIHASTRAINADGSWRNRRGVDPAVLTAVEAELRAAMAAPAAPAGPAAPASGTMTFPQLVRAATERVSAGTLTQADIVAACTAAGLPSLPALAARADLVPTVAAALGIEVTA